MASRQRLLNVEQTKKGKNYAESFYSIKDIKSKRGIARLVNAEGGEITKDEEIQKTLEQHYESTVGRDFTPEMSLTEFLEKYGVELPTLAEAEQNMLMENVTDEELKYALFSAKTSSAPGPSGHSIAIFKYLYSQMPKLMLATINQLIVGRLAKATFVSFFVYLCSTNVWTHKIRSFCLAFRTKSCVYSEAGKSA